MDKEKKENTTIDFSNIANLEAVKATDGGFVKNISAKRKSKFSFVEPELIPLPSKGLLYREITNDPDILSGHIRLLPMTIKEEEILTTSKFLKSGSATKMVLQNCIASDIDAGDILLFDSNYLLFRLRQISYGDDYKFKIKCSNSSCEKEFEHSIKISNLKFEDMPDDIQEPIEVKLPYSKFTVKFIYPRLCHSEAIYVRNNNRMRSTEERDKTRIDNLIVSTLEILDRDGNPINPKDWEDFYEALPGMDRAALTEKSKLDTGVDKLENVSCPWCETSYLGSIPIGIEFFRF
jgi:hypothetical protein